MAPNNSFNPGEIGCLAWNTILETLIRWLWLLMQCYNMFMIVTVKSAPLKGYKNVLATVTVISYHIEASA